MLRILSAPCSFRSSSAPSGSCRPSACCAVAEVVLLAWRSSSMRGWSRALGVAGTDRRRRMRGRRHLHRRGVARQFGRRGADGRGPGDRGAAVARRAHRGDVLARSARRCSPSLYLGLPLGAMVAVRALRRPRGASCCCSSPSSSATPRSSTAGVCSAVDRLAPAISPKKTVEGAIGGFVGGVPAIADRRRWWLPALSPGWRVGLGIVVVAIGHPRRSVRVAAEAQRRREGQFGAHPRPRRRARSDRRAAVRGARVLPVPALTGL